MSEAESLIRLKCPLCGKPLIKNDGSYCCDNNHSFDIARQGYVNLLPVQDKHSLNPGDTKEMLAARRRFLDSGSYEPICADTSECIKRFVNAERPIVADVGCGEGYYTNRISSFCGAVCAGIDISKDGVRYACSRNRDILWLVATASRLPLYDESVDAVIAMFSLFMPEEYRRVLKKGGIIVEVTVGNDHLKELKSIIYDEVFQQSKHPAEAGEGLCELMCEERRFEITLDNSKLKDLLLMTPHFWRIKQSRRELLESTEELTLTVHYWIRVLQKI